MILNRSDQPERVALSEPGSQDDEFRAKRDDVLRVYYNTPAAEHIICLDEKTGIQALERLHQALGQ